MAVLDQLPPPLLQGDGRDAVGVMAIVSLKIQRRHLKKSMKFRGVIERFARYLDFDWAERRGL